MLYRLAMHYFRFKMLNLVLKRVVGAKVMKIKNPKVKSLLVYGLDVLGTIYLSEKNKRK